MPEKTIEVSGKTEEEAIAKGLAELHLERDAVSVAIVQRAKSGFLGIGAAPAIVSLRYSYEENASQQARAAAFLTGLLTRMGSDAVPVIHATEEALQVELKGGEQKIGMLIGRRGETLDAIQHLTNYIVNHGKEKRIRITIDAENYRKKREESLIRLAEKEAGKVVRYRKNRTLEPMNAYERHVIHTALQDYDGISTYSTGTDPGRRVVIAFNRTKTGGSQE